MNSWLFRFACICVAVLSCIGLFTLKYKVVEQEKILKQIHNRIYTDSREIQILKSEWADRNDPENLRRLIKAVDLKLEPISRGQIENIETIPVKNIPVPPIKPEIIL